MAYIFILFLILKLTISTFILCEDNIKLFYIDPTNPDPGNGSLDAPFLSLDKAIKKIEEECMLDSRGVKLLIKSNITLHINQSFEITCPINSFSFSSFDYFTNSSVLGESKFRLLFTSNLEGEKNYFIKLLNVSLLNIESGSFIFNNDCEINPNDSHNKNESGQFTINSIFDISSNSNSSIFKLINSDFISISKQDSCNTKLNSFINFNNFTTFEIDNFNYMMDFRQRSHLFKINSHFVQSIKISRFNSLNFFNENETINSNMENLLDMEKSLFLFDEKFVNIYYLSMNNSDFKFCNLLLFNKNEDVVLNFSEFNFNNFTNVNTLLLYPNQKSQNFVLENLNFSNNNFMNSKLLLDKLVLYTKLNLKLNNFFFLFPTI
jgi:hypothetical protein